MIALLLQLLIAAFIIRYHCEAAHIARFNPLARRLCELSEPVVMPVRNLVKKLLRSANYRPKNDPSALIVACLLALLTGLALTRGNVAGGLAAGLFWFFLGTWVSVMIYSLFLSVIASWLQTPRQQPVLQIAAACHEFVMRPLRKVVPPLGMLDFTPMIALFALFLIKNQVLAALAFGSL